MPADWGHFMKKSKWFFWSFLPFFNFAAWIHAGIRTGRNSYYWLAAVYALPFTVAVMMGAVQENLGLSKQTVDHVNDLGSTAALILWIAGIFHVLLKKNTVDRQIQAHVGGDMQADRIVSNSPLQPSDQSSSNQRENATASVEPKTQDAAPSTSAWQSPAAPGPASVWPHQGNAGSGQQISTKTTMKGAILDYSIQTGEGIISGDDNNRYKFAGSEWKTSDAPTRGQRVDFIVAEGRAIEVFRDSSKAILESRIGKPQTFSSATKEGECVSKFPPKIGKRGWCGVVIVIIAFGTFIGANKSAEDLIHTTWTTSGSDSVFEDEALAKAAGYDSYSDYLAGQNRESGAIFSVVGLALVVWGYTKYNSKKNANK